MRIHWNVARILAAERSVRSAVLKEVAGHPVVFTGARQILYRFTPVAAMQFRSAFTGRSDQHNSESLIVGHRYERGLAVARNAFDANLLRIHELVGFEIIKTTRRAPRPCAQSTPVIGVARLTFVHK